MPAATESRRRERALKKSEASQNAGLLPSDAVTIHEQRPARVTRPQPADVAEKAFDLRRVHRQEEVWSARNDPANDMDRVLGGDAFVVLKKHEVDVEVRLVAHDRVDGVVLPPDAQA
jgi:hypothetical protein